MVDGVTFVGALKWVLLVVQRPLSNLECISTPSVTSLNATCSIRTHTDELWTHTDELWTHVDSLWTLGATKFDVNYYIFLALIRIREESEG